MYDVYGLTIILRLRSGLPRDARRLGYYLARFSGGAYCLARTVSNQAVSVIALIALVIAASLPSPVAGQSVYPPQSCASGWQLLVEVNRSPDNAASSGNDYGRAGLFPVDNYFVMPAHPFVIAVQQLDLRSPYSPVINVYAATNVNVGSGLSGNGSFAYSGVLSPGVGTLRIQSQFVRYSVWYCLVAPTPTVTPTPTITPTPTSTLPPSSAGFPVCLPPPMPTSTPSVTATPCVGAACAAVGVGGLATPTSTPTVRPTVCVMVFDVTPIAVTPMAVSQGQYLNPDVRPVSMTGGFVYRECYDLWPGFELDFSSIPFLSGLGVWTSPPFGACVSYYDFSIVYDGNDLRDYLFPAVAFATALILFFYYRRG